MLRRIPLEKVENFRDVGGYCANYGETGFGIIYRSGSLSDATPYDITTLEKLGIWTVIDLRKDSDVIKRPDKTIGNERFTNISLSVNGNGRVPKNRIDMINSYIEMLEEPVQAKKVFATLLTCKKPCVIHCTAGKDRTGCFIAILLLANGVPFHDVNADYMLSFPYLTRLQRQTKKNYPDFPKAVMTPDPFFLSKVMKKFNKKWGKTDDYFRFLGFTEEEIESLSFLLMK